MRSLFGLSYGNLFVAVAVALALVVLLLALLSLRNPLLPRLAFRRAFRRPGLAALVVAGMTVGTVVLSSAVTTGDTVSLSVRSVVAGVVGASDEVVFLPRRQRRSGFELAQSLSTGTFVSGWNQYMPESESARVQGILKDDSRVAAVVPAVLEQATVANADDSLLAQLPVLGIPPSAVSAGGLRYSDGSPIDATTIDLTSSWINGEAALALDVSPGDTIHVYGLAEDATFQIRGIVRAGDLGGAQATLFLPMGRLQAMAGHSGEINQILVTNRGDARARLGNSWGVTVALRSALMDDDTANRLFLALGSPPAREALLRGLSRGPEAVRAREKVAQLLTALDAPAPTPEFKALAQDPELLSRVASSLNISPVSLEQGQIFGSAGQGRLRVLDVQQLAQDQADRWASAFTTLFVVLGLFSLSTGVILIILIFSLLALERRAELGTVRALGASRTDVVLLLALEGTVHATLATVAGLGLGIVFAFGLLGMAGGLIEQYGFHLEPAVEPTSLVVSGSLGFLITFITVTYASWRASRFSIVSAIRDLADPADTNVGAKSLATSLVILVIGAAGMWQGSLRSWSVVYACGVILAVIGSALGLRWIARFAHLRWAERLVWTIAGLTLIGFWTAPQDVLRSLRLVTYPSSLELTVMGGLAILLGSVWLVSANLSLLHWLAQRVTSFKLGAAEIADHQFRTGLTLSMFALVVLGLTVASVLLTVTHVAFGDPEVTTGGWTIRADRPGAPVPILPLLRDAPVGSVEFDGVGATASYSVQAIQLDAGEPRWRSSTVVAVDSGFTDTVRTTLTSAPADQRDAWRQLQAQPGTAIVGAGLLADSITDLSIAAREGNEFQPFTLWIRDTRSTQSAQRLQVIGLADARGPYSRMILTGSSTLQAWPEPERSTYFFALNPDSNPRDVSLALSLALPDLSAQPIGEELRLMQGVRGLLTAVIQGYMGIGLVSGLCALGVISTRAVVERRRSIGVLRALGATSRGVALMLLFESGIVAVLGAALGAGVGLIVSQQVVAQLVRQTPELRFSIPWDQIGVLMLIVLITALLTTVIPAFQAARMSPATALREG